MVTTIVMYINELCLEKGTLHKNKEIVKELQVPAKTLKCLQVERLKTG